MLWHAVGNTSVNQHQNMKTLTQIFGLLLLLGSTTLNGQSLNIKGKFTNKKGEKLEVNYVLCSGQDTVITGQGDKLKSKLTLNRDYFLTVSLDGYQSKTIWFATYTDVNQMVLD